MKRLLKGIGKVILFLFFFITICPNTINAEATVNITEDAFPDAIFRKYVQNRIDVNHDNILSQEECRAVTAISTKWCDYNVTNFKGIEFFSELESIEIDGFAHSNDEDQNQFYIETAVMLEVSQNTKLRRLVCDVGTIKQLDVTRLSLLEEIRVSAEHEELDLSFNKKLKKIACNNVKLTGKLPDLEELNVRNADMTDFDISASKNLHTLNLYSVKMKKMNLTDMKKLKDINCSSGKISEVKLGKCTKLKKVNLYDNEIQKMSINKCTNLMRLDCRYNQLSEIKVHTCNKLKELDCSQNPIKHIKLSEKAVYNYVNINDSNLTTLNLRKINVKELNCDNGKIKSLKVKRGKLLKNISCINNKLKVLNVKGCNQLTSLYCQNNKLKKIDVRSCNKLIRLYCYKNKLKKNGLLLSKSQMARKKLIIKR